MLHTNDACLITGFEGDLMDARDELDIRNLIARMPG